MYEKKVKTANPGLFLPIIDDLGSMEDNLPGTKEPKFEWVARYIGHLLKFLLGVCTDATDEAVIKARYYCYVILYGSSPKVWGGGELSIERALEYYSDAGNSLGLGGSLGGTDAEAALTKAQSYLKDAVLDERFKDSWPPLVFHLSDGMSSTDASNAAEEIKALSTSDGNCLLVNAYIGTETNIQYAGPEDFPGYLEASEVGPSEDNQRMFEMSSVLPDNMHATLVEHLRIFPKLRPKSRLFFDVRTKEMLKNVIQVAGSIGSQEDRLTR